jgi:hypothetical protein
MPFDAPQMPAPPDPVATANAQGQVNADTARLQQTMNMVDQAGPGYTVRYSRLGPSGQGTGVTVGNTGTGTTGAGLPYYGALANGTPISQSNFNAQAYLAANPDVAGAIGKPGAEWLGADPNAAAWNHYSKFGASEGRTWDGGPAAAGTPAAPKLNWNINWSSPLNNGIIDPYQGLGGGKTQYDQIRRDAGYTGEFGGGAFETWLKGQDYGKQVNYINSLEQNGADPDYIRGLIQQLPNAPGLQNPYSADNTDRWQQTVSLNPTEQAQYDQTNALKNQLLGLASGQATRVGQALAKPLDTQGLPELMGSVFGIGTVGGNSALSNGQIDPYVGFRDQASFDAARRDAGFTGDFGGGNFENWLSNQNQGVKDKYIARLRAEGADPDYLRQIGATADPWAGINEQRTKTEGALFNRLQPQLERDRIAMETRLQQQGVMPGSEAWRNAMDDLNRQQNDARLGVTSQGGDELSRMFAIALQNASLGNSARSQGLQERAYVQNQPINQISALMSNSQVQMPQAYAPPQAQVNPADYQGAVYNNYEGQLAQAQMQQKAQSALFGDIFGLGGKALGTFWGK